MTDSKQWVVGAAGAVMHEGRVLMVRHTYGDKRGRWALPGGYATHDERLDQTAVREVYEETGVNAQVVDVIGLRTRYTQSGGQVFVLFRMRPVSGQAAADGVKVDRIAWLSASEFSSVPADELLAVSRNAVLAALRGPEGLAEDRCFPERDETYLGFLVRWE
jgi:8-oxo-dGTP diphosphatase